MNYDEYIKKFATEKQCREYLIQERWKNGFVCPKCQCHKAWRTKADKYKCQNCGYQISATAGTVFQDLHIPLDKWFYALWIVSREDEKVSASKLQKSLALGSKHTSIKLLKKIEHMKENFVKQPLSNQDTKKLCGMVEITATSIGLPKCVACAVEIKNNKCGSVRLEIVESSTSQSLNAFVLRNIEPDSTLIHKWWKDCNCLSEKGYKRKVKTDDYSYPYADKAVSAFRSWFRNIEHTSNDLPKLITEYCYKTNSEPVSISFEQLLSHAIHSPPIPNINKK